MPLFFYSIKLTAYFIKSLNGYYFNLAVVESSCLKCELFFTPAYIFIIGLTNTHGFT